MYTRGQKRGLNVIDQNGKRYRTNVPDLPPRGPFSQFNQVRPQPTGPVQIGIPSNFRTTEANPFVFKSNNSGQPLSRQRPKRAASQKRPAQTLQNASKFSFQQVQIPSQFPPVTNTNTQGGKRMRGFNGRAVIRNVPYNPVQSMTHSQLSTMINRQQRMGLSGSNSVDKQRLEQFLRLLKEISGTRNNQYHILYESLRMFRMLNSTQNQHATKNLVVKLNSEAELCEFLCLMYLDFLHDFKTGLDANNIPAFQKTAWFEDQLNLQSFLRAVFKVDEKNPKTDPTFGIVLEANNPDKKSKGKGKSNMFVSQWKATIDKLSNSRTAETTWAKIATESNSCFLQSLFIGPESLFKIKNGQHVLRRRDFEQDVLNGLVNCISGLGIGQFRRRTFPINEIPKRKGSKIVVDMSSTGAVRFFAQKARHVISLPNLADKGIVMLEESDVLTRITRQVLKNSALNIPGRGKRGGDKRKINDRNSNIERKRNIETENILNNLANRINALPNNKYNELFRQGVPKIKSLLQRVAANSPDESFFYYKMLAMMNKNRVRNGSNRWTYNQLVNYLDRQYYNKENTFAKRVRNSIQSQRTRSFDLGSVSFEVQYQGITLLYAKMDMYNPSVGIETSMAQQSKDICYVSLSKGASPKRTRIFSASEMYYVVNREWDRQSKSSRTNMYNKYQDAFDILQNNINKEWFGKPSTSVSKQAILKAQSHISNPEPDLPSLKTAVVIKKEEDPYIRNASMYTGILSKFLGDFSQYMYCLANARLRSYPMIFATGDRMTVAGYLILRSFLRKEKQNVNQTSWRDSVVYEDATIYGIHEISERKIPK